MLEGVRSSLMPTLATSAFIEKGVLTPEEFVAAGDELVAKCPTWEWCVVPVKRKRETQATTPRASACQGARGRFESQAVPPQREAVPGFEECAKHEARVCARRGGEPLNTSG